MTESQGKVTVLSVFLQGDKLSVELGDPEQHHWEWPAVLAGTVHATADQLSGGSEQLSHDTITKVMMILEDIREEYIKSHPPGSWAVVVTPESLADDDARRQTPARCRQADDPGRDHPKAPQGIVSPGP
jgi:hypothetical protein